MPQIAQHTPKEVKKFEDMFIRFDATHERDGRICFGIVVVVSSKAINYLHLHRMAVGMSGADND